MINLIYASDLNGCIGNNNKLPWHIPEDLKLFKEKTKDSIVIMGRNTYESLPVNYRPLPGRSNVVVSRTLGDPDRSISLLDNGVIVIRDIHSYLKAVKKTSKVWIIGGSSLYRQTIHYADEIHHTLIQTKVNGDAYFNIENYTQFKPRHITFHKDSNSGLEYHVYTYAI